MDRMSTPKNFHDYYMHPELSPEYLRWPGDYDTEAIREIDDIIRGWQGYPQQIELWDE